MYYTVTINGELIQPNYIQNATIVFSMEAHLPTFQLTFLDDKGVELAQLPFGIGSPIVFKAYETDGIIAESSSSTNAKELIEYRFIVSKILGDDTSDGALIGGYFTVIGVHPWQFFKDYTPHCYPPMKISDLVKKVVNDDSRGYALEIDDDSADTDSTSAYPRYKTNESDYDFIINKVVPYATINSLPVYFYSNEKNKIVLSAFQALINKSIKSLIVPAKIIDDSDVSKYTLLKESFGLDYVVKYTSVQYTIGGGSNANYVKKLLPKFYVEDLGTHKFLNAVKSPTSKMSKSTLLFSGNKVPIYDTTFAGLNSTESIVVVNRETEDQINLAINYSRDLDKMFRLTLNVNYDPNITIGSVVYLYIPTFINNNIGIKATHWATGKWLVYQTMHTMSSKGEKMMSELVLIRPSFSMNEIKTSLMNASDFMEV